MAEEEEVDLKKEVSRLQRRNKILIKRVKKLEQENINLVEELDKLDVSTVKRNVSTACPLCQSSISTIHLVDDSIMKICDRFPTNCKYKEKL